MYLSRTIYLPSLKLLGQSVLELSVAQIEEDGHDLWPTDLNINRDHLLIKDYQPTKFEASGAQRSWVISCTNWRRRTWPLTLTFDLLTWLLIGNNHSSWTIYLPRLKFMRWGVVELLYKLFWGLPTDRPTCAKQYAPSFFRRGGGHN